METTETMDTMDKLDAPSLGALEGDILRLLWDAGEPQSSVQVYEAMHLSRRAGNREMQSPSTIAVTLSRMVEKGLLTVERRPRGGKGYYGPTRTRAEIVVAVLDDVSRRFTGKPLRFLITHLADGNASNTSNGGELTDVIEALHQLKDGKAPADLALAFGDGAKPV